MLLFPLAALVGAAVGRIGRGRWATVAVLSPRATPVVWSALAIQVWLAATPPRSWPFAGRFTMLLVSYLAVGVWLAVNAVANPAFRQVFGVLALGWLLNLAAIVPNGGMPVSAAALASSGIPSGMPVNEGHFGKHVPATSSTLLPWLGDVIPARPLHSVISIGDLVMSLGIAVGAARASVRVATSRAAHGRSGRAHPVARHAPAIPLRRSLWASVLTDWSSPPTSPYERRGGDHQ